MAIAIAGAKAMLDESQRDEALIHFQRGLVLERAHRVQEAVKEYRQAIARYPYLREAHHALGFYYQRYGMLAKAAEEFRIVANLEDDFLARFNLGYALIELGRYDEALEAFQRCIALVPADAATHYEIASIYFIRGEYQLALEQLRVPLLDYAEDWEVHSLAGRCLLRLEQYNDAQTAFGNALQRAARPPAQAEMLEHLAMVDRYREIGVPRSTKDRLYAEQGVVYLGSAQDDGLRLYEKRDYHFTYPDIGVTLRRFMAVSNACDWNYTCVVALDWLSRPLVDTLGLHLDLPTRKPNEVTADDLPLLVLAVGREAELLTLVTERSASESLSFCLGLNWLRHSSLLPDISGVVAHGACSVPWEPELRRLRAEGASRAVIAACLQRATTQVNAALQETPAEVNLPAQIDYYVSRKERLRFAGSFEAAKLG